MMMRIFACATLAVLVGSVVLAQQATKPKATKPPTAKSPTAKSPAKATQPAGKPAGEKKAITPAKKSAAETAQSANDAAGAKQIEARAQAFVEAYNKHDAATLAALFDDDAEFLADEGDLLKGREAIAKRYAERFKATPESWLVVTLDSVQLLTPTIAIEEGMALSGDSPEDEPVSTRYIVVHLKKDGEWYIGSVRDFPTEDSVSSPGDHLAELAWMVGDWVDEHPDWLIKTTCKWTDDGNFLIQDYRVLIEGQTSITGSTRIGWDPLTKQIKSWSFTSDGGHAEAIWARTSDDTWLSKATGVTAEGQISAATHVFRNVDPDTMAWRSYDRSVGGEATPDIEEVLVKRRAPKPTTAGK